MSEPNENDPPPNRRGDREDRGDRGRPRRDRADDDDDYDDDRRGRRRGPSSASNGLAMAGLILGILSLCTGPLAGVPALICAGIALGRPGGRGSAIGGLVTGGIGTLITPLVLIALLLPAVQKVREAATRTSDQNNLKQIGLGVMNYENSYGRLPPAEGNLSWRVHLLPFVEQQNLYMQFDQQQPWDGRSNRWLADQRLRIYTSAADPPEVVETRYRVFVGPGTLYEPGQGPLPFRAIGDGLSQTIFVVEAAEMVPWPQPKELPYDRNAPLPALGVPGRKGFNVGMLDGSVRFVSDKVSPDVIRGGIEPNDGRFFDP